MTFPAALVHVTIARPVRQVYAYVANPKNLPTWAAGLSKSKLTKQGPRWIADSPLGRVTIRFAPKNAFGIVDHEVTLPDGTTVLNPLRIQPNGNGSEVIFTVYRMPKVSFTNFQKDQAKVRRDLRKLKTILEKRVRR